MQSIETFGYVKLRDILVIIAKIQFGNNYRFKIYNGDMEKEYPLIQNSVGAVKRQSYIGRNILLQLLLGLGLLVELLLDMFP